MDPDWLLYIRDIQTQIREKSQTIDKKLAAIVSLYNDFRLDRGITIESLIKEAASAIFSTSNPENKGLRIAHIIARLSIRVPDNFKYLCEDEQWYRIDHGILISDEIELVSLLPTDLYERHLLNSDYEVGLSKDELERWKNWIRTSKSGLRRFLFPERQNYRLHGRKKIQDFCRQRDGNSPTDYPLKSSWFYVTDYDFKESLWEFWQEMAVSDQGFWKTVVRQIADDWRNGWSSYVSAKIQQEGTSNYHNLDHGSLFAAWIEKLRKIQCIPDTYSKLRYPSELLRNTPETSALQRIEAFVHPEFDLPEYSEFLDLLGVRNQPTDTGKIIDRIHALAVTQSPIISEIVNLFDALDRVLIRSTSDQLNEIKNIFETEELILSEELNWCLSDEIYQQNQDRIPGVPVVHPAANHLNLWDRLGVAKRPTIEDALNWLTKLPSGDLLDEPNYARVRAILQRYPTRVYSHCKHWLNLENEWCPLEEITWGTDTPDKTGYLFSWVKASTADLSMLENPREVIALASFERLDDAIEYRVSEYRLSRYSSNPEWVPAIAEQLQCITNTRQNGRFRAGDQLHLDNIRENSERLSNSRLLLVQPLDATPYIQGQPAGFHSGIKALWDGIFLYVLDDRMNNHREVVDALIIPFKDQPIRSAISDCIGRDATWIESYFSTYFVFN